MRNSPSSTTTRMITSRLLAPSHSRISTLNVTLPTMKISTAPSHRVQPTTLSGGREGGGREREGGREGGREEGREGGREGGQEEGQVITKCRGRGTGTKAS